MDPIAIERRCVRISYGCQAPLNCTTGPPLRALICLTVDDAAVSFLGRTCAGVGPDWSPTDNRREDDYYQDLGAVFVPSRARCAMNLNGPLENRSQRHLVRVHVSRNLPRLRGQVTVSRQETCRTLATGDTRAGHSVLVLFASDPGKSVHCAARRGHASRSRKRR